MVAGEFLWLWMAASGCGWLPVVAGYSVIVDGCLLLWVAVGCCLLRVEADCVLVSL